MMLMTTMVTLTLMMYAAESGHVILQSTTMLMMKSVTVMTSDDLSHCDVDDRADGDDVSDDVRCGVIVTLVAVPSGTGQNT